MWIFYFHEHDPVGVHTILNGDRIAGRRHHPGRDRGPPRPRRLSGDPAGHRRHPRQRRSGRTGGCSSARQRAADADLVVWVEDAREHSEQRSSQGPADPPRHRLGRPATPFSPSPGPSGAVASSTPRRWTVWNKAGIAGGKE